MLKMFQILAWSQIAHLAELDVPSAKEVIPSVAHNILNVTDYNPDCLNDNLIEALNLYVELESVINA